jgi:hypothetical protein
VPWENVPLTSENGFNTLEHHLTSQFLSKESVANFLDSKCSALDKLRLKLVALMVGDAEFASYGRNDDRYLLKLHRPLLTSPTGTPILLITALHVLKEKETEQRKIVEKVFPRSTPDDINMEMDADTEEEFQLFRFLLRLNSTRYLTYLLKFCFSNFVFT